jgi:TIR domain
MVSTIEIFCCYARRDQSFLEELKTHLFPLQREGFIEVWHDKNISLGTEWEREISIHLNAAQIIILLVSPDFIASAYCYGKEMLRAMERHEAEEAIVVPIILRPCDWHFAPFGKLQALPKDAEAITLWKDRDTAFLDVARGI